MKIHYTTANGRLTFEAEVTGAKVAFELVASIQELFEEAECGMCKSPCIRCEMREYDGNSYYKMVCSSCGAQMDFGQKKDGKTLFAKRFDKDTKQPMPHRGWYKWQGKSDYARPVQTRQPASESDDRPPF